MKERNDNGPDRPALLMVKPPDPAKLAAEKRFLTELDHAPAWKRGFVFLKLGGPGYLQSALTLGAGTATSCLFAGAAFGYQLLWAPLFAMILGVIVMSAVTHQTLSTGMRPMESLRRFAGPFYSWSFAIGAVASSILWHFAQYSLAGATLSDVASVAGASLSPGLAGIITCVLAVAMVWQYDRSPRFVRAFEVALKWMVMAIMVAFVYVVVRIGIAHPSELLKGFLTPSIPDDKNGVSGFAVTLAAVSAAVGANMLFLYPYSLLARGYGREHRSLAKFDLVAGMLVPYVIACTFMILATANTFVYGDREFTSTSLSPLEAAGILGQAIGPVAGRCVFDFGLYAMAFSSIVLHLLCCGFVVTEVFGWPIGSWKYRLGCLLPLPGVYGAIMAPEQKLWIAVPTTILCGFFLPIGYFGFFRLQRNRAFLGDDVPRGLRGRLWSIAMLVATLVLVAFLAYYAVEQAPKSFGKLLGR